MLEDSKIHKENCEKLKKSEEDSRMILKKLTDHEKLSKDINGLFFASGEFVPSLS